MADEVRCSSTGNVDFAIGWDDESRQQARAIVDKCNAALADASGVVQSLRDIKRYPHTSFFQRYFGDVQMLNERTSDVVYRTIHRAGRYPDANVIVDVYKANVRFQCALKTMWVVKYLLEETMGKFVDLVRGGGGRETRSDDRRPTSTTGGGGDGDDAATTRNELKRLAVSIQNLLNQLPLLSGLLRIELDLLRVYDNCDDTLAVHEFLHDPRTVQVMERSCPRVADTLVHRWDLITSEDAVRNFDMVASDAQCVLDIRNA